jgi:hypothetical protein
MTALALVETAEEELPVRDSSVPTDREIETLDEAIAELRRRRERWGLLEAGAPVTFYSIDYVGTVAGYCDPDPNLMRGDGLRQRWPPGALEKIRQVQVQR